MSFSIETNMLIPTAIHSVSKVRFSLELNCCWYKPETQSNIE